MRLYVVLINWNDGTGTYVEVNARNKHEALTKAMKDVWEVRNRIHSYRLVKWATKSRTNEREPDVTS